MTGRLSVQSLSMLGSKPCTSTWTAYGDRTLRRPKAAAQANNMARTLQRAKIRQSWVLCQSLTMNHLEDYSSSLLEAISAVNIEILQASARTLQDGKVRSRH